MRRGLGNNMFEPAAKPPILRITVLTTNRAVAERLMQTATGSGDTIEATITEGAHTVTSQGTQLHIHGVDEDRVREIVDEKNQELLKILSARGGEAS